MKLIYLASPYSSSDLEVQRLRFEQVMEVTAKLMKDGHYIYSPIAATHPMAVAHELPTDWNYWKNYIGLILPKCDELWIAKMEGWDKSKGVAGEIEMAQKLNIPIKYIEIFIFQKRKKLIDGSDPTEVEKYKMSKKTELDYRFEK